MTPAEQTLEQRFPPRSMAHPSVTDQQFKLFNFATAYIMLMHSEAYIVSQILTPDSSFGNIVKTVSELGKAKLGVLAEMGWESSLKDANLALDLKVILEPLDKAEGINPPGPKYL